MTNDLVTVSQISFIWIHKWFEPTS
jgi:hypothetical protein